MKQKWSGEKIKDSKKGLKKKVLEGQKSENRKKIMHSYFTRSVAGQNKKSWK